MRQNEFIRKCVHKFIVFLMQTCVPIVAHIVRNKFIQCREFWLVDNFVLSGRIIVIKQDLLFFKFASYLDRNADP